MSETVLNHLFGDLPTSWSYQVIGSQVSFLTGPAFDSAKFNINKIGARLVRGINLTRGRTRWSDENTKYWADDLVDLEKYELCQNDVVIGMDGSLVGKNYAFITSSDLPALLVQRVARLRAIGDSDAKYLYYLFATDQWIQYVEVVKTNSGIPHISNGDIKSFSIPYPPLPEQEKIASILTSVDEVIENTQKQIDKLRDLKKATMNELLTKGIGHTEFKESELGRIPKSWEVKSLSEVTLKIGDGIHSTPKYSQDGSFPFINGNNLVDGIIKLGKSTKFVDENEFNKQRTRLGDDTILMSINGTIGNLAVYRGEDVVLGKSSAYLTFINDFELTFAYYLLSSHRVQGYFEDELTGTTIRNLSLKTIRNTPIAVPPISEQNAISNVISSIDSSSNSIQQKLSQTQSLKKSLMQDLLTGKVRVTVN